MGNLLNITGERYVDENRPTTKLQPVRKRIPTGRLSQDLRNCVRGLQTREDVGAYFPKKRGWIIGEVDPDSVPGLGGGGIRARRKHTGEQVTEVIFGKEAHSMVLMLHAGPIGTPISDGESMVVIPFDNNGEGSGVEIMRGRPVRGGYLMLAATYDDMGVFQGPVARFHPQMGAQIETVIEGRMEGGLGFAKSATADLAIPAGYGGPTRVDLRVEGSGEHKEGRRLVLGFDDHDTLELRRLVDPIEIGRLFAMIRAEARRALTETG